MLEIRGNYFSTSKLPEQQHSPNHKPITVSTRAHIHPGPHFSSYVDTLAAVRRVAGDGGAASLLAVLAGGAPGALAGFECLAGIDKSADVRRQGETVGRGHGGGRDRDGGDGGEEKAGELHFGCCCWAVVVVVEG